MTISRGEIWDVELDPTAGAEMQKTRPCVVVSSDKVGRLPLKIIVPVTGWREDYQGTVWLVKLEPDRRNGLDKLSAADAFQLRCVSVDRFTRKRGAVSKEQLEDIVAAIAIVVEVTI